MTCVLICTFNIYKTKLWCFTIFFFFSGKCQNKAMRSLSWEWKYDRYWVRLNGIKKSFVICILWPFGYCETDLIILNICLRKFFKKKFYLIFLWINLLVGYRSPVFIEIAVMLYKNLGITGTIIITSRTIIVTSQVYLWLNLVLPLSWNK